MYKYKFTIFTPTYNREYTLSKLYEDLKKQTYNDFEWLIVDDGSTDNTEELVKKFIDEDVLDIRYIKKVNGGKHTAINTGVKNANGEFFFIVDSDDGLMPNSMDLVIQEWNKVENKDEFCGVVGLCSKMEDGKTLGTEIPDEHLICHFAELYYKFGVKGDKTIVFLTDILKQYPFPEREGIKFLPESVVWYEISKYYKVICINEPMIVREYLEDGLTRNILKKSALKGRALEYLYLTNQNTYPFKDFSYMWIKNYINLARYSLLSDSKYFKEINKISDKFMYILCFPLGYYKYLRQKKFVKE